MRKIHAILIAFMMAACMMLSTSSVMASNWYYVGSSDNGDTSIFIDNDSVIKNSQRAIIWTKYVLADGSYSLDRVYYTHTPKTFTLLAFRQYNADGSVKIAYDIPSYEQETSSITPDSVAESIWYYIWSR